MKDNPITIGIDDSTFDLKSGLKTTQLIGVVCQGTRLVNVIRTEINIDGNNATEKIIELVQQNEKHIQYVLTHTITFGGFNIANLDKIYNELKKPIIAFNDQKVNLDSAINALIKKFPEDYREKINYIISAGNLYKTSIQTAGGISSLYFHLKGIEISEANSLIKKTRLQNVMLSNLKYFWLLLKALKSNRFSPPDKKYDMLVE